MDRKMVNFIKEQYPPGTRIRLNSMDDPWHPIPAGMEGEVDFVDDEGQIFTNWNNGRTLPLIPGEDSFTVLPPELTTLKLYMPLTADFYERNEYGEFDDKESIYASCADDSRAAVGHIRSVSYGSPPGLFGKYSKSVRCCAGVSEHCRCLSCHFLLSDLLQCKDSSGGKGTGSAIRQGIRRL